MRARDGADGQNDGNQSGAGRRGILEQLEAGVARTDANRIPRRPAPEQTGVPLRV